MKVSAGSYVIQNFRGRMKERKERRMREEEEDAIKIKDGENENKRWMGIWEGNRRELE